MSLSDLCGGGGNGGSGSGDNQALREMSERNKKINKQMAELDKEDRSIHKLLLLGAGGCGKSTVLKQMRIIEAELTGRDSFSKKETEHYVSIIQRSIFSIFDTILMYCEDKGIDLIQRINNMTPNGSEGYTGDQIDAFVDFLRYVSTISVMQFWVRQKDVKNIQLLYHCPPVREILEKRNEFDLFDQADYFIEHLERIAEENYSPNLDDILRARAKTVGITEKFFDIDRDFKFRMVDVGGQRNERRKWIHAFDNVTVVIFVIGLSEYDQFLAESEANENRMQESLDLFEEICNNKYFKNKPIMLFLNKTDLFEQKLKKVPLNTFFKDYTEDNSYDSALKHIQKRFTALNKNPNRNVHTQPTCATDTKTMKHIFDFIRSTILRELLDLSGQL